MTTELNRINHLRDKLAKYTIRAINDGSCHKSGEAMVTVTFPGVFQDRFTVSVYSYVLGPSRNHDFHGRTLDEALTLAERAVNKWCDDYDKEVDQ